MNRVEGLAAGAPASFRSKAAPVSAGGFNVSANAAPEMAQEAQAVLPAGLSGMLALQETETEAVRHKHGRRHAMAMLDALQELQLALLTASGGQEAPNLRLAQLAGQAPSVTDPKLADILSAIQLRAKIECLRRSLQTG